MRKPILALIALVLPLVLFAPGCGDDDYAADRATTREAAAPAAPKTKRTTTVKVRKTRYGRILVDGRGRALYLFTRERGSTSRCYSACAKAWPVFHARGRVRAGAGADSGLLGTTRRRGGGRQVTYAGHPLYYYVTDRSPGQVTCQNVTEYGGTWLVVAPSGRAITSA
jgi:predicted lipoprotein with Yx(FWY)xxD motif